MNLSTDDAELLMSAHLDLLAAQAAGVTVLGRTDRAGLIRAAHAMRGQSTVAAVLPLDIYDAEEVAA